MTCPYCSSQHGSNHINLLVAHTVVGSLETWWLKAAVVFCCKPGGQGEPGVTMSELPDAGVDDNR